MKLLGPDPVGLILGSGLGEVARNFVPIQDMPLELVLGKELEGKIPPLGHKRHLFHAQHKGRDIWILQGRLHYYEGFPMEVVVEPVRYLHTLGVKYLILTFACGALKKSLRVGDFIVLRDHIHMQSANPLRGRPNFIDCTEIYSRNLSKKAFSLGRKLGYGVHSGVYVSCDGPSYETPSEVVALRNLGADVVGMSVTAEALVARSLEMEIAAIGWVSNLASGLLPKHKLTHDEVLEFGKKIEGKFSKLILSFLESF